MPRASSEFVQCLHYGSPEQDTCAAAVPVAFYHLVDVFLRGGDATQRGLPAEGGARASAATKSDVGS